MYRFQLLTATLAAFAILICSSSATAQSAGPPPKVTVEQVQLRAKLQSLEIQRTNLERRAAMFRSEIQKLEMRREELLDQQDKIGLSTESFPEIVKMLQVQKIELTIEISGLDARRQALIAALEKNERGTAVKQASIGLLENLLAVEEEDFARVKKLVQMGTKPQKEMAEVKRRMLEVEVKIAEAKAKQTSPLASQIQSDLLNTSLERAERKARLESTTVMLTKMIESRKALQTFKDIQRKLDSNRAKLNANSQELLRTEFEMSTAEASLKNMNNEN